MNFEIMRNEIQASEFLLKDGNIPFYHDECKEIYLKGGFDLCEDCQKIQALKSLTSVVLRNLEMTMSELESTDLCLCQKRGTEIVCQYDEFFKVADEFFSIIHSKYILLIEDDTWLAAEGKTEEAKANREAVDRIYKAIDDYEELKNNKFHSHQRLSE
jgi:hypothetical protein